MIEQYENEVLNFYYQKFRELGAEEGYLNHSFTYFKPDELLDESMISKLMSAAYKEARQKYDNKLAFPIMITWCASAGYALINLWKHNNIDGDLFEILMKEYGISGMPEWSLSLYEYDDKTKEDYFNHFSHCGVVAIYDSKFNPPFKVLLETELWMFEICKAAFLYGEEVGGEKLGLGSIK